MPDLSPWAVAVVVRPAVSPAAEDRAAARGSVPFPVAMLLARLRRAFPGSELVVLPPEPLGVEALPGAVSGCVCPGQLELDLGGGLL